ncbi:MAG: thiamine ABC transporter substrate binding subunit [Vibrionaceae bacterium]
MKNILITCFISALTLSASMAQAATASAPPATLTVYTYRSFASEWGPGLQLKQNFEKECQCQLNFVALDDGVSLVNRLRLEGNKSKADVVLGLDKNLTALVKSTGLIAPHNVDTSAMTNRSWSDADFVAYDHSYFAFVYDKKRLKTPPTSFDALLASDLKIIYQDPRTSSVGQGLLLWVKTLYGDDSAPVWKKLAQKTVTVTKGWSEAYSLFLKGEADMVLSYTSSPLYHLMQENETRYASAYFSEGHYQQVEVAAQLKTSSNPKLAKQFLTFLLSDSAQLLLATRNYMYPTMPITLPDAYKATPVPQKALELDEKLIDQQRSRWIKEWQTALIN